VAPRPGGGDDFLPCDRKVVLYDPSVCSLNMGDHIIAQSAGRHLLPRLSDAFMVDVSTHLPVSRFLPIRHRERAE